jgi:ABC-type transport system involved in cytochrome c biogenesis ATPase subunit
VLVEGKCGQGKEGLGRSAIGVIKLKSGTRKWERSKWKLNDSPACFCIGLSGVPGLLAKIRKRMARK